jgi:serine/threonine-protein kinase
VYEVEDATQGKRFALKVLRNAHAATPEQVERMARESMTMVRVAHPNIVEVLTSGVTADGAFYYAMEMLEGRSLRVVLNDVTRLPMRAAVGMGIEIGAGLALAHAHGVVHRDVKPDNIFLSVRGPAASAKLLDFGVAALLDNLRPALRETGRLFGTPRYASPQQQRGERAHPSMDIWALGYVLYETLVGHGPFRGGSLQEILIAVQSDAPAFRISDFLRDAPPALDALLASMLEKDVSKRAPSMASIVAELEEVLEELEAGQPPLTDDEATLDGLRALVTRPGGKDIGSGRSG